MKLFVGSDGYGDGEQQRDFVHVDDAVSVNLWLLENRDVSGIFNCGTGRAQTFNEVAAAVINTRQRLESSIQELVQKGSHRIHPVSAAAGRQVPELHPGRPGRGCARPAIRGDFQRGRAGRAPPTSRS